MDWEAIHGLMEDAIYGGRVDNAYDLRVLRAYLRLVFAYRILLRSIFILLYIHMQRLLLR